MDTQGQKLSTPPGPEDGEYTGLSACDICYQRKIKCDRKLPCSNCKDARTNCSRLRQKQKRRPRENVSSKLKETKEQMEARMASLENAVTGLIGNPQALKSAQAQDDVEVEEREASVPDIDMNASASREKLKQGEARNVSSQASPANQNWKVFKEPTYATPPYSTIEAQNMIEQELKQGSTLSKHKREAFHAALSSLSDSLTTSSDGTSTSLYDNYDQDVHAAEMDLPRYPEIETIKWLLSPGTSNENVWALPETLPVVTRNTICKMAMRIQDPQGRIESPGSVVCVCSMTAHFLMEHLISQKPSLLDPMLQVKVAAYLLTAQKALSQISILTPPKLENLQAFIFGSVNAQEAGHPLESWKYNVAACNLAISFNLHKKINAFTNASPEDSSQARYCFMVCYVNDKGLAMNLGKPPCLPDAYMEVDIRSFKHVAEKTTRQFLQSYVIELAIVQSKIIELQYSIKRLSPENVQLNVNHIVADLDAIWIMIEKMALNSTQDDIYFEVKMGKFSYYTMKTILFHSCIDNVNTSIYREPSIEAARSAMHILKEVNSRQNTYDEYKAHSFAHWCVLYYPFTSFFVLFCNVISKKSLPDYERMLAFVEYLVSVKKHSTSITKLHNLCLPFCALASTALKSTDEPSKTSPKGRPSKRARVDFEVQPVPLRHGIESPQRSSTAGQVAQIEQHILPAQNFISPLDNLNNNAAFELSDEVFAQFMDFQPRLQWLDTDFSAFEQTWGSSGFGMGSELPGSDVFQGDSFL